MLYISGSVILSRADSLQFYLKRQALPFIGLNYCLILQSNLFIIPQILQYLKHIPIDSNINPLKSLKFFEQTEGLYKSLTVFLSFDSIEFRKK